AVIDLGNGSVALIDAGNDPKAKNILKTLETFQVAPEAVSAIFVTHGHGDHVNGARMFTKATIFALENGVPLIEGHAGGRGTLTRFMPHNPKGLHVGEKLHDGDSVTMGLRKIEVFAVPGHTGGSAVYLVDGALYFGDSAGADKNGNVMRSVTLFSDD